MDALIESEWALAVCLIAFMWLVRVVYERHMSFVENMYDTGFAPTYQRIGWRVKVVWISVASPPVSLSDADVAAITKPSETEIQLRQRLSEIHSIVRLAVHPDNLPQEDLDRIAILSSSTFKSGEMPILEAKNEVH